MRSDIKKPTLIEHLLQTKEAMGAQFPSNIRIEPVLTKQTFEGVPSEVRDQLKELVKER